MEKLFTAGDLPHEFDAYRDWAVQRLKPLYERTDAEAMRYQRAYQVRLKWLSWLSVIAIATVALQILFVPSAPHIVFVEVVAVLAVLLIARRMERGSLQELWLRNRYLAERMRAAIFMLPFDRQALNRPAPVRSWVVPAELEHEWSRLVAGVDPESCPTVTADTGAMLSFVRTYWLDGQVAYHKRKQSQTRMQYRRIEQATAICIYVTLAAALVHASGIGRNITAGCGGLLVQPDPATFASFLSVVLPSVSAAAYSMLHAFESRKMMLREARIAPWLQGEIEDLKKASTTEELRTRVTAIAEASLHEVAEWYSVSAHKKPEA